MSDADLNAIEARASAAMPGPWRREIGNDWRYVLGSHQQRILFINGTPDDGAFAAHARDDVPALVAEVRRLRTELADSTAAYEDAAAVLRENDRLRLVLTNISQDVDSPIAAAVARVALGLKPARPAGSEE